MKIQIRFACSTTHGRTNVEHAVEVVDIELTPAAETKIEAALAKVQLQLPNERVSIDMALTSDDNKSILSGRSPITKS